MDDQELFKPEEMLSPFDGIKETDSDQETFWLSQRRMTELFGVTIPDITYHLKQINDSGEVQLSAAIRKIRIPSDNCDDQGVLMYNLGKCHS